MVPLNVLVHAIILSWFVPLAVKNPIGKCCFLPIYLFIFFMGILLQVMSADEAVENSFYETSTGCFTVPSRNTCVCGVSVNFLHAPSYVLNMNILFHKLSIIIRIDLLISHARNRHCRNSKLKTTEFEMYSEMFNFLSINLSRACRNLWVWNEIRTQRGWTIEFHKITLYCMS